MVASQAVMEQSADDAVAEMVAAIETHAASGDWDIVEELSAKLRNVVMQVPAQQRRDALMAAHRSVEQVRARAQQARRDVADKLSAIRRGQDATKAYAGTD